MNKVDLLMLNEGEELFAALERMTLACLNGLQDMTPEDVTAFLAERQGLLSEIETFTRRLSSGIGDTETALFRERQAAVLQRVRNADGLLIALAQQIGNTAQTKLSEIGHGRTAMEGYRRGGNNSTFSLKGKA